MEWLAGLTTVDYVFLVILMVSLAIGWIRGLVELLMGLVVFTVTMLVAGRYTEMAMAWLKHTWGLDHQVAEALERRLFLPAEAYQLPVRSIPWERAQGWLREIPIPEIYKATLAQRLTTWSQSVGGQTAAEYITHQMANGILSVLVFGLLALLVGWLLMMLGRRLSDQIKEFPILGTTNRLAGGLALVLQTVVMLSLVIALVMPVLSVSGFEEIGSAVQHARLTPYFVQLFEWIRRILFGTREGLFFTS